MKNIFILLITLIIYSPLYAIEDGWIELFNGKNLDGWRVLNGSAEYRVENGVIVGKSKLNTPTTFLVTEKD